ncbi:flagellar filament capping protein FliD [Legionella anisa]|uniref:Flagellar hook-associated protein 2 n=1 Tax=Legionella anisa TaxID=28082 RepID=A0AAX0WUP2_9GAMM|nr:flagellar filament capping protein FliD [Legionella anisa]AWN74079.1 flagellar hook protein FliD [Legionella anisa]KTC69974.1 flagellar hook associated protein 2 FliD [Legionella anisa]MBN5936927.1 flagellar filament capping protein FliD [Legionella anisa]MCW8425899.1 flagellar filament capping protein FliD [Legionella anisa]MCW8448669.1 flagellar filament capping protein FliD [Legionella anisa]
MGLSTPGIGSGLDIKAMVESMVKADLMPAQVRHDKKLNSVTTELSAFGQLKSAISNFQTTLSSLSYASELNKMNLLLSEPGYISASVTEQAAEGLYQIKVNQLAQAQSLASGYFTNNSSSVGSGSITINFGTYSNNNTTFTLNTEVDPVTINITPGNDSLSTVRDAINAANAGVTAAIVQDGVGSRLTLTSSETGEKYAMQITGSLTALNYDPTTSNTSLNQTMAAQNSQVQINGLLLSESSNQLENALTGITLDLRQADPATTITLTVKKDVEHLKGLINDFVKKYNDFINFITALTGFDMETRKRGVLQGDDKLRDLKTNLYHLATNPLTTNGPIQSLADLGITSDKHGLLEIDSEMLDEAIKNNYQDIGNLFAKKITATDPNIKINSLDTEVAAGAYDVILNEYTPGMSMSGTIGGVLANSTDGITLNGTGDFSTLSIDVLSGLVGDRGQIIVSDGLASLIDGYLDSLIGEDGEIEERIDRLNTQAKQLDEMQERINERSITLEKRYYKQWNAVDLLISQMQNTSNTLTQILSNLPKLKTK